MSNARKLAANLPKEGQLFGRNVLVNGAMNVAQRAVSASGLGASTGYFTCDRWKYYTSGTAGRVSMAQNNESPNGFNNSISLACTTADTSIAASEQVMLQQRIEGQNLQHFKKGTSDALPWILSFYVKGNASATYVAELMDSDNSDRHVSKQFTVGTNWSRVVIEFPADTTGALDDDSNVSIDLHIILHSGSNFTSGTLQQTWGGLNQANRAVGISSILDSTSRVFYITGVQLEAGGVGATPFEHEPFGVTLSKCQRYAYVIAGDDDDMTGIMGYGESASNARFPVVYPVIMRGTPTFTLSGTCRAQGGTADGANFTSGLALINENTNHTGAALRVTGSSNLANDRGYNLQIKANGTRLIFDAEL